ncbi:MAG: carboxypeptidase regulatory-like domain-containing protein [Candidatus Marinimicrobia bacterium]|nr:carboxypeptidase regulatory-like domain-containing protein [Candidatus Neomarinimicrobiota bacterium]
MKNNILNNKLKWSLTLLFLLFLTLPFACETILNEATITGKVVNGETTQPVEGAFIRAIGFSESVETDSFGSYTLLLSIEDPEIDAVTLEISKSGFLTDTLQNIGLKLGGTVNAPPLNLIPIAATSGQVIIRGFARNAVPIIPGELGEPIDSAFVRVLDIKDANAIAYSDSKGRYVLIFSVDSDDSNSITIQVSKSTFLPDTISNIGISFTDTIIVRDANLIPISTTSGDATIFGKVINSSSGSPIEAVTIRALNRTEEAQTDSSGEYYLLLDIKFGTNAVTLEASKEGFNSALINNLGIAIGDTVSAPPVALLALSITEGIASLSGNVINGLTKAPIEGALIRALNHKEIALSDLNGDYVLSIALAEGESNVVNIEIGSSGFLTSTIPNVGLAIGDTIVISTANLLPIDPEGSKAIVKGVVVDDVFFEPIDGVQVRAIGHNETTLSNELGNFSLSIVIKIDESNVVDLIFSQDDFVTDTLFNVALTVDRTITLANQEMTPANQAGPPSNATLVNISRTSISIKGRGGEEESSELTYRLQDESGITLDRFRPIEVFFYLFGPRGGEFLSPLVATTDADGLVRTALNSGTKAGVVQVIARFDPGTGADSISSVPTPIAIHGGHPDSAHFSLRSSPLNIAGLVTLREANVTAFIGDKFSNLVRPGTAVQFQSKYGIIQGSAVTNEDGQASVKLISAEPLPIVTDNGLVRVTGETKDEDGKSIFDSTFVLFSGHTQLTMLVGGDGFVINNGGSFIFTFQVDDVEWGNPIEGGSTIEITATAGALSVSSITIPDTQSQGAETTIFTFTLSDDDPNENPVLPPVQSKVTITVTSPNGNLGLGFSGTVD